MSERGHDTLVRRLALMLVKLNQGESVRPHDLAQEFGVNVRTVQRDLNERFGYLPLEKAEDGYRLAPAFLGRIGPRDIERFASLAGVRGLFPSFSDDFLRDIFDSRIQSALLVKGPHYEDLRGRAHLFGSLEQAIIRRFKVTFRHFRLGRERSYVGVDPYKLLNHNGIWYLVAKTESKLKTFTLSKIDSVMVTDEHFAIDPSVDATLAAEDGIWFGSEHIEFILKVGPCIADYFRRRPLLANQTIVKDLADGGLIVSARVGHPNEVLPHVRYWIPHIKILDPEGMQRQMESEMLAYMHCPD